MSTYRKKDKNTLKIYQVAKKEGYRLQYLLLEDLRLLFSMSRPQEWMLQQEDIFGIY